MSRNQIDDSPRLDRRVQSRARHARIPRETARLKETIMNRNIASALVVAAAALAGNAFAESPTVVKDDFVSTKTRAEVTAELVAYKQAGVNPWSTQYNPLRSFKSAASRAQVTGAYIAARDQVAALHGEDSGSAYLTQTAGSVFVTDTLAGQPVNAQ